MSKRTYLVREIDRRLRRAAEGEVPIAIGGGTVLTTRQHRLDGPEHTHAGDAGEVLYGDGVFRTPAWKQPVRAATTAAGTLATSFESGDSIDGVALATGDRILVKDQAAGAENGVYVVAASGAPARASDMDVSDEVLGAATFASEGTVNGNKAFVLTTNAPIVLGTTTLVFTTIDAAIDWGEVGDITTLDFDDAPAAGATGEVADAGHRHGMPASLVSGLEVFLVASVGVKGYIRVPFTCHIERVTLLANTAGNMVVDVWNDTYANFPPTVADSICAAAKPTLAAAQKYEDATLTGWDRDLAEGTVLGFNVDSTSGLTDANLEIKVTRNL